MPAGVAYGGIAGVAASLAGGEDERVGRIVGWRAVGELGQFRQQFGDVQVDPLFGTGDGLPAFGVGGFGEDHPGRVVEHGLEQAVGGQRRQAVEAGAGSGLAVVQHVQLADAPDRRGRFHAGGQGRAEGTVEQDRRVFHDLGAGRRGGEEGRRERLAPELEGQAQRPVVFLAEHAHGF